MTAGKFNNLTGKKFGRLTVLERDCNDKTSTNARWICRCDCGGYTVVKGCYLTNGATKSCGCLQREIAVDCNTKHGHRDERIYSIWRGMRNRCKNSNIPNFGDYGGRGIAVCEEWVNDFMSFYSWSMENGYSDELSLDRIDNNGSYSPENCRWATRIEQASNKRNNRFLRHNGEIHTIAEWGRIIGIDQVTILKRVKLGWSDEKILTTPVRKIK